MNLNEALRQYTDTEAQESWVTRSSVLSQKDDNYPSAKEDVELLRSMLQVFKGGSIYVKLLKNDDYDENEIHEVYMVYGKASHSVDPAYADRVGEFALRAADDAGMNCESPDHYLEMTISNNDGLSILIEEHKQGIKETPKMSF